MNESWMLPCISKKITGMDCPGCGIQRSISFLLQGKFIDSFLMYPGLLPIVVLFSFLIIDFFIDIKRSEKIKLFLTFFALGTILISYGIKMAFLYS